MKPWSRFLAFVLPGLLAAAVASAAPVIAPSGVSTAPASAAPGATVTVSIAVTNGGAATPADDFPVGGTVTGYVTFTHRVTGTTISVGTSGSPVTFSTSALIAGAGGAGSFTRTMTVPTMTSDAGAYDAAVTLTAASSGTASGSFTSSSALTVTGNPDFQITSITYTAGTNYKGGDVLPITLTYRNNTSSNGANNVPYVPGSIHASFFRISVVLSQNATYGDADDFLLTFHDVATRVDATSVSQSIAWNQLLPGNYAGSYYVLAKVDSLDAVTETIENDTTINGNNIWGDLAGTRIALQPTAFPTNYLASTTGSASAGGYSDNPSISSDGRYTVFASDATNLIAGDSNGVRDIFLFDNNTSTVRRVNHSQQGTAANGASQTPAIAPAGRYVAFSSEATNLVLGDTNGFSDIFVVDTQNGDISRVSVATAGTQADGASFRPSISSDGRYVVFESSATNLAGTTAAGLTQIYLRDRTASTTTLVSQSTSGTAGTGNSLQAVISSDGAYVAFASDATNLVAGDTNSQRDVFLRHLAGSTTIRVSVVTGGAEATGGASRQPSISSDGAFVAFASDATNLVAGDTNAVSDVFVYDRAAATTSRVSVSSAGAEGTDPTSNTTTGSKLGSFNPAISSTGRYVAFVSLDNNLAPGDTFGRYLAGGSGNGALNVYVHDRDVSSSGTFGTGGNIATRIASVNRFGYQTVAANTSQSTAAADIYPAISADGRWIAVPSDAEGSNGLIHNATNLLSPDGNGARDVVLVDRRINQLPGNATLPTVSITSPGSGSTSLVNTTITISASATTTVGVISTVQFYVNGATVGSSSVFPYTATWRPTAVGTYTLSALATDSLGNIGASTNVSVTINASPSVAITSPVGGTLVPVGSATAISASASASTPGATIASVQFYANGTAIGAADTTAPFSASWTPAASGTFSLTATATDSAGVQATSTAVSVSAGVAPSGSIVSPANGATISVNATQTVLATASSSTGVVASVQFFANGVSLGTDSVFPFTATWTPTTPGTYSLTAVATDNVGNTTTSSANSVTVSATAVTPTIAITSPAAASAVALNATTTITVNAASPIGNPASVQFFADAVSIGTATTAPFSLAWTPTTAGAVSLTATITDSIGTSATSAAVAVTVGTGPVVAITAPTAGANISVNTSTTLLATATSAASTIANVQFFANGVLVGAASTFPYTVIWTPTAAGSYSLTARATDAAGNINTSAATAITVTSSVAPSVSITAPAAGASLPINVATTLTSTSSTPVGSVASVQYLANGTAIGTSTTAPFSLSWTPTTAGAVSLTAVVTNTLGTQTTSAAVAATVGTGPVVAISTPTAGATLTVNTPQTLLASATSASSTIASVQFLVNGTAINSVSSFPYTTVWTPTAAGSYSLTALATDAAGNQTTSAAVAVTVSGSVAPTVAITSPTAATTLPVNVATTLTVNAATPVGSLASVQYFANAVAIGTSTTSPFSLNWTPTTAGAVSLTAVATNNIGTQSTSAAVAVNVGTAPTVAITAPGSATSVTVNLPYAVTATASSAVPIRGVQFFVAAGSISAEALTDGTVGSPLFVRLGDSAFPYGASWTPVATGPYTLAAVATDSNGNKATASVVVTVNALTPGLPSVSVVSPPSGTTITANQTVVLAAIASDPDGAVTLVEFLDNGQVVGSKATAPYFTSYTPTTTGAHVITAVVTDNDGNRVTSAASNVTVAAASGTPPTVAMFFNNPALDAAATASDPFEAVDVSLGSTLILTAAGASTSGTIASAQFFVNGVSIGTDAASPFYTTHTLGTLGQIVITALVTDSLGNRVLTVPLFLNGLPSVSAAASSVSLISPVNGAPYVVGENIIFNATHNFGTDVPPKIDFYINGTAATTVAAPPYQFIRGLTRAGTYDVHAVVRSATTTTVSSLSQITVSSNTAPTVSITNPAAASSTAIGTSLTIDASASDTDGTIQSVQFFANGVSLATDTTFPYTTSFNPGATGTYQLRALATDNAGNQTLSAIVSVTVTAGSLPTVSITAPANPSSLAFGSTANITATASSNVTGATIASVQFFANGVSLGVDTTFPYAATFTPGATGAYVITAQAIDTAGNQATSTAVNVTVATNVVPTVSITAPANGSSRGVGGAATTVTAVPADTDGTIASVQFFLSLNGATATPLGTVTASPYSVAWTPRIAGTYTLTATATDNLGAVNTVVPSATVTVSGGDAPTATLSAPANVAVNSNATFTATAAAVATGATIASVQFFANDILLGSDATFPYSLTFAPTATGAYAIRALVTDTFGNQTLTGASTVNVAANTAPTISLAAAATSGVGASNTITATTSDTDGSIASVQFFVSFSGSTPVALGTVTSPSALNTYTVSWTPIIAGNYSLTAIATDNLAATATSSAVGVVVSGGNAPTGVAITAPATGSTSAVNTPVNLTATATAAGSATIARLDFFANGVAIGSDATFPYTATFTPTATGTYSLEVYAVDTAGNQTRSTAVSLSVTASGGATPTISLTSPASGAVIVVGTANAVAANALANAAGATIANVQFFANGVALGADTAVPYTATFTPVAIGTYTITATTTDTLGNQATTSLTVTVNDPPSVSVTAPAAGATLTTSAATTVSASASDSNGTIAQVEFFASTNGAGAVSIGVDATSPYSVSWTPTIAGAVSITAVATDNNGTTTTSAAVAATVTNTAPVVSVTAPAAAATIPVGSATAITATATDADGSVASVQFFVSFNGGAATSLGTDTTVPFAASITPAATGSYALTAVATDNLGATTTSAVVTVTAAGGTAPTVAITAPAAGAARAVNAATIVTADAAATAAGATIASVQFFANGVALGTDTTFPYEATWTPTAIGTYALTAIATDSTGAQATSLPRSITVQANTAPTITVTAPATLGVGVQTTLTATPADADGTIASVQFFANGTALGTAITAAPYTVNFTSNIAGTIAITATATDNLGTTTTSAPATITVTGGNAPTVAITAPATGSAVPVNVLQSVTASANAVVGTIASVEFRVTSGGTTTTLGTDTTFPYAATWTPTSVGTYTLTALATDTSGNQGVGSATITVTATSNTGPSVSIVSPANASTFTAGSPVVLFANASDANGTVSNVRFLVDGQVVGGAIASVPYSTVWTPTAAGAYSITAIAVDNDFNATTSVAATVNITAPTGVAPTATITSPTVGTILTTASTVPIVVGVSSATVTSVQFFANGVSLGSDNTAPFSLDWSPTAPGAHRLVAVATAGTNIVSSQPVDVTVNAATSPQKPSINLTSPTDGSTVAIGTTPAATVTLTANASDLDGTIAQVQFFVNGVSVGTDTTFPYSMIFTPVSLGSYVVRALATDNAGNVNASATATFTSVAANAPTVAITNPLAGASMPNNLPVTIDATANAGAGFTITSVQFLANGTPIATDTTFPYSITWTPTSPTTYTLTAIATDNAGTPGTSTPISVTVLPGVPPTGNITTPAAGANLTVGAATSIDATASASGGATVASVDFRVNNVSIGLDTTFPYSVAWTPTAIGTNVPLTIVVTDTLGNTFTSTATLINVISAPGPTAVLTAPVGGSTITIGTPTAVTAAALPQAAGTTIANVQFFANGVSIGTITAAPYTVTWLPTTGGAFALTARATDSNGTSTTSAAVNVSVTTPPATVAITSPTGGAALPVNTPTTIAASATTTTGTVVNVAFFVNGVALATDTTFPFSAPWTPATPGTFALTARATDNFGTVTTSPVVTVSVVGGNVPTVAISSPASQSTVAANTSQVVVVNATAANGTIAQVQLFANGVSLGTDLSFPYNFAWTPGGIGNVLLTAVATDSQGTQATSAAVSVTIAGISAGAPTVALTSPAAGAALPVGVATLVTASATDADGTIANVEFFANGVSLAVDSVFPYNFSFTPGATGTYVITARATDNGGNIATSAAVSVTVTGGTAPSVAISAPAAGATLGVNAPQEITATATSPSGFITSVAFFLNGAPLSTDTSFPYAAAWTPGAVGTYTLTARATDNLGNITDSAVVTVTVGASNAPTVALSNPVNGSSYTVGTPLTVAANAADSDGTIAQVLFFVNGVPLNAADLISPYSTTWTANATGVYTLTAQATDNNGNVTTSSAVTVTIGANAAPTVALTSPVAGSYSLGNLVLVSANANDSDGTVASVQFFANGLAIGTATAAPFSTSWRPTLPGNFTITAQATDNVGNVTTAVPVSVTITSTAAPTVTITNPVVGTAYGVGNAIPFAATPSGGNGPIAQVQFFVNGTSLGAADAISPYSATWTPNAPGTYLLLAVATDSAGLSSSTSATLSINISGNNAPTVAMTSPASGTSVNAGATVNLAAVASDADGTVANVRFIANGNVVGTATSIPFSTAWVPSAAGSYTVTAQATDNSGNVTNSTAITVTVVANRAPTVALTAPGNGSTVRVGSGTTLTANANDTDGTIASVQFFANGLAIGAADTTAPYAAVFTPGAEGIYRITATALDSSGAATISAQITVLAVIPGAKGADVSYSGIYQGAGESGRFAAINVRGSNATFIAFSNTTPNRVYFFSGLSVDTNGGFSLFDTVGRSLISGSASDTGATGTLDAGRLTFIGTVSFGSGAGIATGYYTGSITGRPESVFAGLVGADGNITIYVSDGTFRDAGSGVVSTNGNFTVTTLTGTRFTGRADPATGFITGAITGGLGGSFTAAVSSGVSFSDGFLKNLSTRGQVGTGGDILIAGFIVAGEEPKQVLIRAIGPSLAGFGVTGALADTQLQLFNGNTLVATNDNWGGSTAVSTASNQAGAFPLSPSSLDSVIYTALPPGSYTAQVSGVGGRTGIALIELYDTDSLQPFSAQKVTNVATRGVVGTGPNQLIAGFVVSGNTAKKVLIRAVGPTLGAAPFNVGGVLSDPILKLVRSNGSDTIVRENDNWEMGNDAALINEAAAKVGAFPLAAGAKDAAILINLPPGTYSAQVTGPGTTTGVALVEVYEVP